MMKIIGDGHASMRIGTVKKSSKKKQKDANKSSIRQRQVEYILYQC